MSDKEYEYWLLLDELTFDNQFVRAWNFSGNSEYRIYFKPTYFDNDTNPRSGFNFLVAKRITYSSHDDSWSNEDYCEIALKGYAYFDGIRHIYIGSNEDSFTDDNYGYLNYPDLEQLINILTDLRKLEKEYCRDID